MQIKMFFAVVLILSIAGCASGVQKLRKIDPGMSTTQVGQIMGRRDSFKTVEKNGDLYTFYEYTNQFCNVHVSLYEKCDFYVIFKNGRVVETGVKDVRSNYPNTQFIHLFRY